jgi:hypothetical protein
MARYKPYDLNQAKMIPLSYAERRHTIIQAPGPRVVSGRGRRQHGRPSAHELT